MSPDEVMTGLIVTFGRTFLYDSISSFMYAVNGPYSCHQISIVTGSFGKPAGTSAAAAVPPAISVSTAAVASDDNVRVMFHFFISLSRLSMNAATTSVQDLPRC